MELLLINFIKCKLIEIINKFLFQAEQAQSQACEKFENMSAKGREELTGFRARQVTAFKKR